VAGDGDYNGDGSIDILLRNDTIGTFWEYQMNDARISGGDAVTSVVG
jgi:hypothetical protein